MNKLSIIYVNDINTNPFMGIGQFSGAGLIISHIQANTLQKDRGIIVLTNSGSGIGDSYGSVFVSGVGYHDGSGLGCGTGNCDHDNFGDGSGELYGRGMGPLYDNKNGL